MSDRAIASFERTIISARSSYDRYHSQHDNQAISAAARRGETLFLSQPFTCFRCHNEFLMGGGADFEGREAPRDSSADLLAFLNTLTDQAVVHAPRFANRWTRPQEPR